MDPSSEAFRFSASQEYPRTLCYSNFRAKYLYVFLFSLLNAACPVHRILLDLIILIFGEKKFLIMKFSVASCFFIPLNCKYSR
jgi:hypothetical protein